MMWDFVVVDDDVIFIVGKEVVVDGEDGFIWMGEGKIWWEESRTS